jgi:carbamoyltransferase
MTTDKPITILGVSESHVATACLLQDGRVVACVSEERLNRTKHWAGFPAQAVKEVLRIAGVAADDVDKLVLHGFSPWAYGYVGENQPGGQGRNRSLTTIRTVLGWVLYQQPALWPLYQLLRDRVYRQRFHVVWQQERLRLASEQSAVPLDRVVCTDHHRCHAYAGVHGLLGLPSDDYLVLTNDGAGDGCCATVSTYSGGKWHRLSTTPNHHSLAHLYMAVTQWLGMKPNEHEYKVMGLAPYASAADMERTLALLKPLVWRDGLQFDSLVPDQAYDYAVAARLNRQRFDWVAGAVQALTEQLLREWAAAAIRKTGVRRVILSGGIFLNVKANMCIGELEGLETLRICPSPGDDSSAIGAAYWGYEQMCSSEGRPFRPEPLHDLYLGRMYSSAEIEKSLARFCRDGAPYAVERCPDIEARIAELLAAGHVVARFAGRMEFGARALGNRSLLAHPADPRVIGVLNRQIKNRDFWMPFAGTILSERQQDYLINAKGLPAPHMVLTFSTTDRARQELQAAMHPADHTIRPQVLDEATNPGYYKVLKCFEAITGIGGVLNTSFNLHGDPIVCSPDDALTTFSRSGLRFLALDNLLVSKHAAQDER